MVSAGALLSGGLAASATTVTLHPTSVAVSTGNVSIVRTTDADGVVASYRLAINGPLTVHGWSHNGTVRGASDAPGMVQGDRVPGLDVASPDGVVTGSCGGDRVESGLGLSQGRYDYTLDCVLSHDGGTPWQVTLAALMTRSDPSPDVMRLTGSYRLVDAETSLVDTDEDVTYGDVQLTEWDDAYDDSRLGPLRLSGHLVVGSATYTGDLVSGISDVFMVPYYPALDVSGSNGRQQVGGTCTPAPDGSAEDVLGTGPSAWTLSCRLSLDGGPLVAVPIHAVLDTVGSRAADYRSSWLDRSGYFTTG